MAPAIATFAAATSAASPALPFATPPAEAVSVLQAPPSPVAVDAINAAPVASCSLGHNPVYGDGCGHLWLNGIGMRMEVVECDCMELV